MQELRWRGCGARLIGVQGRKCELWWSGTQEGNGGVGVVVKEEMHDEDIEVRRVNDRVMSLVIVFVEGVLRVVCAYAPHSRKLLEEKNLFA